MAKYLWLLLMVCATSSCTAQPSATEPDCDKAISTIDINHCANVELGAAEQQMHHYLQKSQEHHRDDAKLVAAIEQSQESWQRYAKSHCDAIYTMWRDGSIRGVMSIACKTKLTQERTHQLWSAYLTYMDDSQPVLPEPK